MNATVNATMDATTLNETTLYIRLPALIFLGVAMTLGVFGHAAIIYIYGFRMKRTNVFLFINLLSLSDITSVLIVVPLEIYRIRMFYIYDKLSLCKFEMYFLFGCYINSTFLLLIISVERYVRVCRSSQRQLTLSSAKKLGFVSALIASILAIPSFIWTDTDEFLMDGTIITTRCSPSLDMKLFKYALIVFGGGFPIWVIMLVVYIKIVRRLKQRANRNIDSTAGLRNRSMMRMQMDQKLSKTNRSIICITIVFVSTCTFYFCFILINKLTANAKSTAHMYYFLFLLNEAWVINVMFNPFIFGFMNTDFRKELFKILRIQTDVSPHDDTEVTEGTDGGSIHSNKIKN